MFWRGLSLEEERFLARRLEMTGERVRSPFINYSDIEEAGNEGVWVGFVEALAASVDLTASAGDPATFAGGTASLTGVWDATGGVATFGGGTATAAQVTTLTASGGLARFGVLPYRTEVLADSPVSYWRLGETTGTSATDEQGVNTGTYVNTPTLAVAGALASDPNRAASFDGASSEYVQAKAAAILASQADWTIETWVKAADGQDEHPIYTERAASGNDILKLEFGGTGTGGASAGVITLTYRDDAGTLNRINTPLAYDDNGWHHVAVTKDNTAVVIYVDGVQRTTGTLTATDTFTNSGLEAWIAGDKGGSGGSQYLTASVDEVAVYTSALTAGRVAVHYAAGFSSARITATVAAASGLATFGGGTASLASVRTATGGLATFGGGTANLSVSLTASSGLATFGGGTATAATLVTSLLPGRQIKAAPGLNLGRQRRAYARRFARRRWVGTVVAAPVGLSATGGVATFNGGTTSLTVTLTASSGLATFAGGTSTLAEVLTASSGLATYGGGSASLTVALATTGGLATFGGGIATYGVVATSSVPARRVRAADGLNLGHRRRDRRKRWIATKTGPLNLTATGGVVTFSGPATSTSFVLAEGSGVATFGGGTANTGAGGLNLTASNGLATFGGSSANLAFTITAVGAIGGRATYGGGTANFQSFTGLFATNGLATFGGGTASPRFVYLASGGVATFVGGTATAIKIKELSAAAGVATFGGQTATLREILAVISGLVTFGGGTATSTIPTLGKVDGNAHSSGIDDVMAMLGIDDTGHSSGVDDSAISSGIIDSDSVLTGVG
jgi:hypothetical protein